MDTIDIDKLMSNPRNEMPERPPSFIENEEKITRIRARFRKALLAGMTIAEASEYANEPSPLRSGIQAGMASEPATVFGHGNVQGRSGESSGSVAAPDSPKLAL